MPVPSQHSIAQLLTQLVGKRVAVAPVSAAKPSSEKQIYGTYTVLPEETMIVVKTDLSLFSALAGALVGLPAAETIARAKATPMDETVHDAIFEVLNVFSAAITFTGRTVFNKMELDPASIEGAAADVLKNAQHPYYFNVTMDGSQPGSLAIFM